VTVSFDAAPVVADTVCGIVAVMVAVDVAGFASVSVEMAAPQNPPRNLK